MSRHSKILFGLGILFFATSVFSQDLKELAPGYYIVVSAYAKAQERVAQRYVDVLKGKGHLQRMAIIRGADFILFT